MTNHTHSSILTRRNFLKASAASLPLLYGATAVTARAEEKKIAVKIPTYTPDPLWPPKEDGFQYRGPNGVAVDPDGRILVAGGKKYPVLVFSPEAKLLDAWGRGIIARKHELRIYNNKVYICDITMQQVYEFTFDGELLRTFGKRGIAGPGKDEFNWPTDVAVAENGDFYITDGYGNSRVVCLSPEGKFQFSFGTKGAEPGQFERPHGIVIDKNERLLVADRKNNRIQIFDMNGKFLDQWTNVGKPFGLFLTPDNLLYVADGNFDGPHRILILDLEGNILSQFGSKGTKPGQFDTPHSLTVDPEGNLYVAECENQRVQKFVPQNA